MYFGFVDVDPDLVSTEFSTVKIPAYIAALTDEHYNELKCLTRQGDRKNFEIAASFVAYGACVRYTSTGRLEILFTTTKHDSGALQHLPLTQENAFDFEVAEAVKEVNLCDAALNKALINTG